MVLQPGLLIRHLLITSTSGSTFLWLGILVRLFSFPFLLTCLDLHLNFRLFLLWLPLTLSLWFRNIFGFFRYVLLIDILVFLFLSWLIISISTPTPPSSPALATTPATAPAISGTLILFTLSIFVFPIRILIAHVNCLNSITIRFLDALPCQSLCLPIKKIDHWNEIYSPTTSIQKQGASITSSSFFASLPNSAHSLSASSSKAVSIAGISATASWQ